MADIEGRVRRAAQEFHDAIVAALAAGYRVAMPYQVDELPRIAITETAIVGQSVKPTPGDEYEVMHKTALVELATARGIDVPPGATKADVIGLLKNPPAAV